MPETDSDIPSEDRPPRQERRLLRLAAFVAAALALYALAGFVLAPPLMRWAIQKEGREALHREVTLGKVTFNPFTLETVFRDLRIRDRDRQPLLSLRRLHARLGMSGIFRRAWRLRDLTIDEPVATVRVLQNGSLSIADLFTSGGKSGPPPRLIIDHLAVRSGRVDFIDESVTPHFATRLTPVNVEVNDFITIPDEQGEHALQIGFNRESTIRISGKQVIEPLGISGRIEAKNVGLTTFTDRLTAGAPVVVRSGHVDIAIPYDLRRRNNGGIQFDVKNAEVTATGLALSPRDETASTLTIPRIEVREASLAFPARRVEIGLVRLIQPQGAITWDAQGQFNWSMKSPSSETRPPQPVTPAAERWSVKVARTAIERGSLHVENDGVTPPALADLSGMTIEATGISDDTHAPIAVLASADANGRGRISVRGTLVPSPFSLDSQTSLSAIDLMPFRAYASPVPGLALSAGTLGFDGRMLFSSQQPYLIEGNSTLTAVEFHDLHGKRLLGCRTATLHDLRFDANASRNLIRRADLDGLYADVAIDKQKNLNLSAIGKTAPADAATTAGTIPAATAQPVQAAASGEAQPAASSLEIALIDFRNATIDYRDDSLVLPFATLISPAGGTITDFSTTGKAASTMHFSGSVAEHGSMSASGTLRAVDPFAGTDLSVQFRGVPMPTLTPYAAEFAGYSIERGLLDLDLHYRIVDRRLTGDHRIVATNLTLGQKVAGSHAGFAVRLAVALLKDRQGRIQMEVPIEGTVDSPEFNYRTVLWQSVKTILGNVARSPFRALAAAMGTSSSENLDLVSFEPGEATVLPSESEKLAKMAAELTARPELNLGVEGRFDRDLDTAAIRKAKLEAAIASRRGSVQMASASGSLDSILEELYSQTFSSDRLAEERAKFTKQPATPPAPPAEAKKGWHWRRSERAPQSATKPVSTEATFDATGFYDDVRSQLVAAQSVSSDDLQALARGRSAAVLSVLTANGLDQTRVKALPPSETKNKSQIPQVGSALQLSAESNGSASGAED